MAGPADNESALVVPVPAAGPVVESLREELDPAAALGVPAHVSVVYPFLVPDAIDDGLTSTLGSLFAAVPSFRFRLASVAWFGQDVVWLRPDPGGPFRRLTELVTDRWPRHQPYGGAYEDVVPHLTLGARPSDPRMAEAAHRVEPLLPIECHAKEVWLMAGSASPGSWTTRRRFQLGE